MLLFDENIGVEDEDIADPQDIDTDLDDEVFEESEEDEEVADPQEDDSPESSDISTKERKQTTEDDAKFAAARREAEKYAREAQLREQTLKSRQDSFAKQFGYDTFEEMEEAQKVQQYVNQGVDPTIAKKMADIEKLEQDFKRRTQQARIAEQKAKLRDEPYFKEFESEIDSILESNPHLDLDIGVLFDTVKGRNINKILEMSSKAVKQKTLNDINSKNHIKADGKGVDTNSVQLDEAEWRFYKGLNPKAKKEDYIKFKLKEQKGR